MGQQARQRFEGLPSSPGVVFGKIVVLHSEPARRRYVSDPESEAHRLRAGMAKSQQEIELASAAFEANSEAAMVLQAHALMHADEAFANSAIERIRNEGVSAEWALTEAAAELVQALRASNSEYLRERAADVEQVCAHMVSALPHRASYPPAKLVATYPKSSPPGADVPATTQQLSKQPYSNAHRPNAHHPNARHPNPRYPKDPFVLFARSIAPAELVKLAALTTQAGLVCTEGSATAHTLILARALGVPCVVGVPLTSLETLSASDEAEGALLDGDRGSLVLNPSHEDLAGFKSQAERIDEPGLTQLRSELELACKTPVRLDLNLNFEPPASRGRNSAGDFLGVGLFRSEYPYLVRGGMDQDEQAALYARLLNTFSEVTVRLLDLGGDKGAPDEQPSFGGWNRGVRWLLEHKSILRTQLRALAQALAQRSAGAQDSSNELLSGRLRVLIPMVRRKAEYDEVAAELTAACAKFGVPVPPLGAMVEVPALALEAARWSNISDFLSVGTNDLFQFTMAESRSAVAESILQTPFLDALPITLGPWMAPAFVRLLSMVAKANREATVCGEMASSRDGLALLIGLGFRRVSVQPSSHGDASRLIAGLQQADATEFAKAAMEGPAALIAQRDLLERVLLS